MCPASWRFRTQPIPVKPPPLARVGYRPRGSGHRGRHDAPSTPGPAKRLVQRRSAASSTPDRSRRGGIAPTARRPAARWCSRAGLGGANWGGTAFDPTPASSSSSLRTSARSAGSRRRRDGSPAPYDKTTGAGRGTFDVRIGRRQLAVPETSMGPPDGGQRRRPATSRGRSHWASPSSLPAGKQNTGRPALGGSDRDRRRPPVRRLDRRQPLPRVRRQERQELWITQLDRRGNADPITYASSSGKQYVAVVATDTLITYALAVVTHRRRVLRTIAVGCCALSLQSASPYPVECSTLQRQFQSTLRR